MSDARLRMKLTKRRKIEENKIDETAVYREAINSSSLSQSLSVPDFICNNIAQFSTGRIVKCLIAHCSVTTSMRNQNHFRWRCRQHRTPSDCSRCKQKFVSQKLLFCQGMRCQRTLCLQCANAQDVVLGYRCYVCFDYSTRFAALMKRYRALDEMSSKILMEIERDLHSL